MATNVVMPQMGESVAEGTIVRWLKNVGDVVERDEPLLEISTDKVDAEIPAPASGVVAEIRHKQGETVDINTVLAVIRPVGEQRIPTPPDTIQAPAAAPVVAVPAAMRRRSSPVARNIARVHDIDLARVTGRGIAGRVVKADVLAFRDSQAATLPDDKPSDAVAAGSDAWTGAGLTGRSVPMSVMRKRIAEHMIASRQTSAHVHSVVEVNFTAVERQRQARKAEFERAGTKLTYLSFILKATADALQAVPVINASLDGDQVVYHRAVNVGIAVALDWGLIVPVIKDADRKSLLELSQAVVDLAARARAKKLKPEEVSGGTFTITNPGVFGALFGMPIINQPQVAILGVGAIEKRVVSIDEALAIRPMAYLSLGFDHRIVDGAVADTFLAHIKHALEAVAG